MKNLKIKLATFCGMLLILSSCSSEQVDSSEQTDPFGQVNVEFIGKTETGFNYSSEYSDKFNYYNNGIKLTNKNEINKMLNNAVHIFYEESTIEIAMTSNEEKIYLEKNKIDSINNDENATEARAEGDQKIYYYVNRGGANLHGKGSKNYGSFRPTNLRFGNLSSSTKRITTYAILPGRPVIVSTFTFERNRTLSFYNPNGQIYAHAAY